VKSVNDTEKITMRKLVILGLVAVMLLPLLVIGCGSGSGSTTIELTLDELAAQNNVVKNITLNPQDTLTVKLGSNPTTGFSWADAVIGNAAVIEQVSRDYIAPTATGIVGAGGTEVWVFSAKSDGTTTIQFSYGRPWQGGEQGIYTLTINVTVK
jgi:inhibitor of cysteine peptidase